MKWYRDIPTSLSTDWLADRLWCKQWGLPVTYDYDIPRVLDHRTAIHKPVCVSQTTKSQTQTAGDR